MCWLSVKNIIVLELMALTVFCIYYFSFCIRRIKVYAKDTEEITVITIASYFDENEILKQLKQHNVVPLYHEKILGLCSEEDGLLIPLDLLFVLAYDSFMEIVYSVVYESEFLQNGEVKPNGVISIDEEIQDLERRQQEGRLYKGDIVEEINGKQSIRKFDLEKDFLHPSSEQSRKEAVTAFNRELRLKGYVIMSLNDEYRSVSSDMFDLADEFFHMPPRWKAKLVANYGKGERRGYKREGIREYFEMRSIGSNKHDIDWPEGDVPYFKGASNSALHLYYCLARSCLEIVAEGVGLSKSAFDHLVDDLENISPNTISSSMFRIHRYSTSLNIFLRCFSSCFKKWQEKPHADIGLISISPKATLAGLEVRELLNPEQGWITVENEMGPNDIVIFSGQTLARVTSGLYRPVLHRPATPSSGERYSIVFFLRAQFSKRIESIVKPTVRSNWRHAYYTGASLEQSIREKRNICATKNTMIRYFNYHFHRFRSSKANEDQQHWTIEL